MNKEQILEECLRNLENFGGDIEKYTSIIKNGKHDKDFVDLIEEIREEMTKEYHKRIDEAISKCGVKYDESKSLMYISN